MASAAKDEAEGGPAETEVDGVALVAVWLSHTQPLFQLLPKDKPSCSHLHPRWSGLFLYGRRLDHLLEFHMVLGLLRWLCGILLHDLRCPRHCFLLYRLPPMAVFLV